MVTTRTRYKLAEAEFFLEHLEQHWRHTPNVDFYLSAFVSAARSVTWVMRAEFGKLPGWEQWFASNAPPTEMRELLRRMNDVRTRSTKVMPVKTRMFADLRVQPGDTTTQLMDFLARGAAESLVLEPVDQSNTAFFLKLNGEVLAKAHLRNARHELPEFKGRDSKDVCREYFVDLQRLVAECHERFDPYPVTPEPQP